jgi:hypothetical protein
LTDVKIHPSLRAALKQGDHEGGDTMPSFSACLRRRASSAKNCAGLDAATLERIPINPYHIRKP